MSSTAMLSIHGVILISSPSIFSSRLFSLSDSYYWSLCTAIPVCCDSGFMCSIQCIAVSSRFLFITCKVGFLHI
jgi:hypothetical protein